jgi:DNA mismatch repair protein MutS
MPKTASTAKKSKITSQSKGPRITPMVRHYLEMKAQHPDALLFYRMGDFFELFFEDAEKAARILGVTLTARHKDTPNPVPMCGVPHHALETYLGKALAAGVKVAICDQVEDPKEAKGLVRREVTRVVTPGTVSQPGLLEGKEDNFLAALVWRGAEGAGAFLDVSTGTFFVRRFKDPGMALEDLGVLRPREVLAELEELPEEVRRFVDAEVACTTPLEDDRYLDRRRASAVLLEHFEAQTLRGFGLEEKEPAVVAAASALAYARATQHNDLSHVRELTVRDFSENMVVDATTLANLEVFRNQREGGRAGSLVGVLDRTVTPAGGRLLGDWLRRPLKDPARIASRHDAVEELHGKAALRDRLRDRLSHLGDPERLLSRAVLGSMTPREASALRDGLQQVPAVLADLTTCDASLLAVIADLDSLEDLLVDLENNLVESPPASLKNGGVIAEGVDEELDRVRSLAKNSKQHMLGLEAAEREKTGIPTLKIRYNKVFGYYLEVTKANQHLVPEHYIRKQTLVNAERYITPEIKELEEEVLGAEERQLALEEHYFQEVRKRIVEDGEGLRRLAAGLSSLDVLAGFAEQAARRDYCRPRVGEAGTQILVREGRHPVVEAADSEPFVPNDVELDGEAARIVILTGPNMGGKSTYLRQVALIVLMAQAGSFVPARSAEIGAVDRIFTRVGASDDLARGESTFMVEMIETANILRYATPNSLVILDEVGRGTATFDGLSLAWAIVEYLHRECRPRTLFATHYHELTELSELLPGVVNRTLAVREWEDQIIFLRRVIQGSADKSYGLHVARLAGLPPEVVERASEVLANLEAQEYDPQGRPRRAAGEHRTVEKGPPGERIQEKGSPEEGPPEEEPQQLALFAPPEQVVAGILQETDLDQMTPLAAMNLLHSLKSRLGGGR